MTYTKLSKITCLLLLMAVTIFSCKKDSTTSKPELKFKSISSYEVTQGKALTIVIECNDITNITTNSADTAVGVQFVLLNKINTCSGSGGTKTKLVRYAIPDVTNASGISGKIELQWDGSGTNSIPGNKCRPSDTTQIKIWVKSKAGLVSDTIFIDRPVVIKNS